MAPRWPSSSMTDVWTARLTVDLLQTSCTTQCGESVRRT